MELQRYDSLRRLIDRYSGRNLFEKCFETLRKLAAHPAAAGYRQHIDALEARFFYMLRYLVGAPADTDVTAEYNATAKAVRRIADEIVFDIHAADDPSLFWSTVRFVRMRPDDSLESLMADYLVEHKRLSTDVTALTDTGSHKTLELIASDIFNLLWIAPAFDGELSQSAMAFLTDGDIPQYDRRMWVAAVGLGLMRRWDSERAEFLKALCAEGDIYIASTAKVWLALAIGRIADTDDDAIADVKRFIEDLDSDVVADITDIIIEKIRSEGADALSNEYRRTMGKELNELGKRFASAGDASDFAVRSDAAMADMPEGTFDRLKQFNEAAMAGDDVLYGTLGAMRSSPFFGKVSNWFLPFHPGHSALAPVVDTEGIALAEVLVAMPMLTDGDKFALVLSAAEAPEHMRRQMLEATAGPLASLFDDADAREALDRMGEDCTAAKIYNTLVRDVFRFATRFVKAGEVIGNYKSDYLALTMFDNAIMADRWRKAVTQLTKNGNINTAIMLLNYIFPLNDNLEALLLKGRLYELEHKGESAFTAYHGALMVDSSCLEAAMGVVRHADDGVWSASLADILAPFADSGDDSPEFLEFAGMACMHNEDFDGAARYFQHLDFVLPEKDVRAKRLLGSAFLAARDFDAATDAFGAIGINTDNVESILDHGLALWLAGRRAEALDTLETMLPLIDNTDTAVARELTHRLNYYRSLGADLRAGTELLPSAMHYRISGSNLGKL